MAEGDYKKGDRVIVNERAKLEQGRKGTVGYVSGGQHWVHFDGDDARHQVGFFSWWLDALPSGS